LAFLKSLQDRDQVSLQFFDNRVYPAIGPAPLGKLRSALEGELQVVQAAGGTALYEATAQAFDAAPERARPHAGRIPALVVMTDGRDESSRLDLRELQRLLSLPGPDVKVFTIAYGDGADVNVLGQIAEAAKGSSVKGTAESIVQVYEDMASFF